MRPFLIGGEGRELAVELVNPLEPLEIVESAGVAGSPRTARLESRLQFGHEGFLLGHQPGRLRDGRVACADRDSSAGREATAGSGFILGSHGEGLGERRVQRRRQSEEAGHRDAEEPRQDPVGHLVIFRPADAVHKKIGQANRAKSVVVNARARSRIPCFGNSRRTSTAQHASICGESGKRANSSRPSESSISRPDCRANSRLRTISPLRQTQNGASTQPSFVFNSGTGWVRLRTWLTARYSARTWLWIRRNGADGPGCVRRTRETDRVAQPADRQLEVAGTPLPLDRRAARQSGSRRSAKSSARRDRVGQNSRKSGVTCQSCRTPRRGDRSSQTARGRECRFLPTDCAAGRRRRRRARSAEPTSPVGTRMRVDPITSVSTDKLSEIPPFATPSRGWRNSSPKRPDETGPADVRRQTTTRTRRRGGLGLRRLVASRVREQFRRVVAGRRKASSRVHSRNWPTVRP